METFGPDISGTEPLLKPGVETVQFYPKPLFRRPQKEHEHEHPVTNSSLAFFPILPSPIFFFGSLVRFEREQYSWKSDPANSFTKVSCA